MSLDFIGTIPSPAEVKSNCEGKTPAQMADAFMAMPAFVDRELRLWIQILGEDPMNITAYHLIDADRIIKRFATGSIGYDDFVAQLLAHPVMALDRCLMVDDITDLAKSIFPIFLGRVPVGGEAVDFSNLFRPWLREHIGDPNGVVGYRPFLAAIDPNRCNDAVYGSEACTSTLIGPKTTMKLPLNPQGIGCYNYLNLGDHPNNLPGPPDGYWCYWSIDGKIPAIDELLPRSR